MQTASYFLVSPSYCDFRDQIVGKYLLTNNEIWTAYLYKGFSQKEAPVIPDLLSDSYFSNRASFMGNPIFKASYFLHCTFFSFLTSGAPVTWDPRQAFG